MPPPPGLSTLSSDSLPMTIHAPTRVRNIICTVPVHPWQPWPDQQHPLVHYEPNEQANKQELVIVLYHKFLCI